MFQRHVLACASVLGLLLSACTSFQQPPSAEVLNGFWYNEQMLVQIDLEKHLLTGIEDSVPFTSPLDLIRQDGTFMWVLLDGKETGISYRWYGNDEAIEVPAPSGRLQVLRRARE